MSDELPPGAVVAVGTAVGRHSAAGPRIERAIVDAVHACHAKGITDDKSILEAKMAAFERVKAEIASGG